MSIFTCNDCLIGYDDVNTLYVTCPKCKKYICEECIPSDYIKSIWKRYGHKWKIRGHPASLWFFKHCGGFSTYSTLKCKKCRDKSYWKIEEENQKLKVMLLLATGLKVDALKSIYEYLR
jgi:phage FluMu protein Com